MVFDTARNPLWFFKFFGIYTCVRINKTIQRIILETSTIPFNFLFRPVKDLLNYNEREII